MFSERRGSDGMLATLITVSSGSCGNNYILDGGDEKLILEAGVPFKECVKALGHDISNVRAVITTHGHIDHAKYIPQYQQHGIPVYSNSNVADAFIGVAAFNPKYKYRIGGYTVMALEVPHGDTPNMAYVIDHPAMGRLLFATDLTTFPYNVKDCNHLLIECNYSEAVRVDALLNCAELRAQSRNHMELNETIVTIRRLGRPHTILCHLSQGLSDEAMFKQRIFAELGIHAEIAVKGSVHNLSKEDF